MANPAAGEDAQGEEDVSTAATYVAASEEQRAARGTSTPGDVSVQSLTPGLLDVDLRDQYDLGDVLGAGGMGAVYRARDAKLHRTVAVKVMHDAIAVREDLVKRFFMEAQVTAQLEHPGIVPTYTIAAGDKGEPRLAMRLIPGQTLETLIETEAKRRGEGKARLQGLTERLELFVRACDAVHFAHERGVVHRDLKPENIMIGRHHDAYVMDWGLAKLRAGELGGALPEEIEVDLNPRATRHGEMMGTLGYMPPEQALGKNDEVGPGADQFALALTLQELVSLSPARDVSNHGIAMAQALKGERYPLPDWVPLGLRAIIEKSTANATMDRYPDTLAFAEDIRRFIRDEELSVLPDRLVKRVWRVLSRHQTAALGAALILVIAISGLVVHSVTSALARAKRRAAHEQYIAGLVDAITGRAQDLNHRARAVEVQLATLTGALRHALARSDAPAFDVLRPGDITGPRAPSDTTVVDRYRQRISFERAVYSRAPNADTVAAERDERQLHAVEREFRRAYESRTVMPGATADDDDALPQWLYGATPAGVMLNYPGASGIKPDYDPRQRPWYRTIVGTEGPQWSLPYGDAAGSGALLPCNRAVYDDDGELIAVVGFDFRMADVRRALPLTELAGYRDAWLLDSDGRITANPPDPEGSSKRHADVRELVEFTPTEVPRAIRSQPSAGQVQHAGLRYVYARVPAWSWTYVVALSADAEPEPG